MRRAARVAAIALGLSAGWLTREHAVFADAPTVEDQVDEGFRELDAAKAAPTPSEKREHLRRAQSLFEAGEARSADWRSAGGLAVASLGLGSSAAAAAWYWLASDRADYSDAYLTWQKGALSSIFDRRAAITFDYSRPPKSVHIDDVGMPSGGLDRPFALDPGTHDVRVTTADGGAYHGKLRVKPDDAGKRLFFKIDIHPAGWVDPASEDVGKNLHLPPPKEGMSALQIVTIVATVGLASGIAVGGGYILFGRDNPRGLDSTEGAVVVTTELVLIGAGTFIAIISD
ncbi:MAG TPA: hypothetical protein VL400_15515 [Polyangiaceae bacterium]|jgi:hypothetical protein|nr:hypothetical protein [Polyangiaceae bacterium]